MKKHNIVKITFFYLLLSALFVTVYSQGSIPELTKEQIIKKSWQAMFGDLKPDELKSIYIETFFHGREVPSRLTIKRPNLFRNENPGGVLVFDGKRAAWAERAPDKDGNPREAEMVDTTSWRHFEIDIAIAFPAYFDYPSELKGIKKLDEKEVYELFVQLPLGGYIYYFIDSESFLVKRRLISWEGKPAEDLWENLIDKYIDYEGILFPDGYSFKGREGMEKGLYKNVKFNIEPEENLFIIPSGLKQP